MPQTGAIFQQTAGNMVAQNLTSHFPKMGDFLYFLEENLPTKRKFSNRLKFSGVGANAPLPITTPLFRLRGFR